MITTVSLVTVTLQSYYIIDYISYALDYSPCDLCIL